MIMDAKTAETNTVIAVAQQMCTAARTAPKTRGIDYLETAVVTGEELEQLADEMERLSEPLNYPFFMRDAQNVRDSAAVVLIGTSYHWRGLNDGCAYCNFQNCADCKAHNAVCCYDNIDLGIAIGSAVGIAADARVDNRVLFSAGRAAVSLKMLGENVKIIMAIPLSAHGKSPYFDRQPKK